MIIGKKERLGDEWATLDEPDGNDPCVVDWGVLPRGASGRGRELCALYISTLQHQSASLLIHWPSC
jgi:hypothetical protein